MANLPDTRPGVPGRRRSTLSVLDDAVLVVVAVVAALVVLKVLGVFISTIFFVLKLAAVAGLIFFVARLVLRRRD